MVFIHPRYVDLLFRVNYLRDCISDLIVERDRLINFTCEEIKADYMLKIGSLKYKEMLLKNKVKKIGRKIELIEENNNISEAEINEIIQKEFEKEILVEKQMFKDIDDAINYSFKEALTDNEAQELDTAYSILIKIWNPLLNPKLTLRKKRLFESIEEAYKNKNIRLLKNYVNLAYESEMLQMGELDELIEEEKRYTTLYKEIENAINNIKNSFPYKDRELLLNSTLVREEKDIINVEIAKAEDEASALQKKLDKLLKNKMPK